MPIIVKCVNVHLSGAQHHIILKQTSLHLLEQFTYCTTHNYKETDGTSSSTYSFICISMTNLAFKEYPVMVTLVTGTKLYTLFILSNQMAFSHSFHLYLHKTTFPYPKCNQERITLKKTYSH